MLHYSEMAPGGPCHRKQKLKEWHTFPPQGLKVFPLVFVT
jgi:hypothetical protein